MLYFICEFMMSKRKQKSIKGILLRYCKVIIVVIPYLNTWQLF
jgi:hypothetical protein